MSEPTNGKKEITPEALKILRDQGLSDDTIFKSFKPIGMAIPKPSQTDTHLNQLITFSKGTLELKNTVRKLSVVDDCVLILGETGTGKELLAKALHGNRAGKFIEINCASMPEQLLENELFGHERGAFTDAKGSSTGLIKTAINGTMFLDEIGEMPIHLQSKLLTVIQERKFRKLGSTSEEDVKCRFVAASNKVIDEKSAFFREDLYWRLSTFILQTIPLRNRPEDWIPIAKSLDPQNFLPKEFFDKLNVNNLTGNVRSIQQHVRRFLVLGQLPGN